jgi:hypothetical protein
MFKQKKVPRAIVFRMMITSLTLMQGNMSRMFENSVLRSIFGPKKEKELNN